MKVNQIKEQNWDKLEAAKVENSEQIKGGRRFGRRSRGGSRSRGRSGFRGGRLGRRH